jgi:molecular chaperone DnaJ
MSARDYVEKDYYKALGVPKDATAADIKKAYRKLARDLHPDTNPGGEDRFKEVSEAYDVLSDDSRRREYDEARSLFGSGLGGLGRPGSYAGGGVPGFDIGDLLSRAGGQTGGFSDVLGGLFGGGRSSAGRAPRRGTDVEADVTLSFADAVRGATVPLQLTTTGPCTVCGGSGAAPGTSPKTCATCSGAGVTSRSQGGFAFSEPCRTCRGSGRTVETPCPGCGGGGRAAQTKTLNVRIPAGVSEGQKVRLAGRGGAGERGGPDGDLMVTVHVTPHPWFGRKDDHVTVSVPVTFPEAALGAQVSIPTLDGPVTLKVPAGTTSGRTFRVRGRGVPGKGDQLATVEVAVPQRLTPAARKVLEAFAAEAPEDPREHLRQETQ